MSFGGGWFFVAQSEAISVMNKNIKLPGLGSYMAAAVEAGDTRAAIYAIGAMVVTIVAFDQLVWRPLIAWAEKFKIEQSEAKDTPTSWFLELLQGSYAAEWIANTAGSLLSRATRAVPYAVPMASVALTTSSRKSTAFLGRQASIPSPANA